MVLVAQALINISTPESSSSKGKQKSTSKFFEPSRRSNRLNPKNTRNSKPIKNIQIFMDSDEEGLEKREEAIPIEVEK